MPFSLRSCRRGRTGRRRQEPRDQLRALGAGDLDLDVVADRRGGPFHPDDAVGVDALAEAATFDDAAWLDPLDEDFELAADPARLDLGDDAVLQLLEPLDTGAGGAGPDAPVEGERGGAVLGRVGEEGDPVQAGLLQEVLQLAHVRPALAGKADDEVGAEGG